MGVSAEIVEVGPRDGIQSLKSPVPLERKVALVDALSAVGFGRIECASFVSPKRVPQMADSGELLGRIERREGVRYLALVPNETGLAGAIAAKADEVAIFASASEGFARANLNASIEESFARMTPVAEAAHEVGLPVRGYVSCVTDCPYEGPVPPPLVAEVVRRLLGLGCYEVSLGETLGRGTEAAVRDMLMAVTEVASPSHLAGHFHDTEGRALGNVAAALEAGIRVFDSSVAGLGGCPFAPGAAGNVATEALAEFLKGEGFETGLDRDALARAREAAAGLG